MRAMPAELHIALEHTLVQVCVRCVLGRRPNCKCKCDWVSSMSRQMSNQTCVCECVRAFVFVRER